MGIHYPEYGSTHIILLLSPTTLIIHIIHITYSLILLLWSITDLKNLEVWKVLPNLEDYGGIFILLCTNAVLGYYGHRSSRTAMEISVTSLIPSKKGKMGYKGSLDEYPSRSLGESVILKR